MVADSQNRRVASLCVAGLDNSPLHNEYNRISGADLTGQVDMTLSSFDRDRADPFTAAMRATSVAMVMTDPRLPDNPIVFANDAFLGLTGYSSAEVIGHNCRFLHGPRTDPVAVAKIRDAIDAKMNISIDLGNYRKDGSSFHNGLHISPVFNEAGELRLFFASQLDLTDRYRLLGEWEQANRTLSDALETTATLVHEIDHRVKNNLQMVSAMILLQSLDQPDPELRRGLTDTLARVEALSTVHRRFHQSPDVSQFDVADYVRDLLGDLVGATGRTDIRLDLDLASAIVPASKSAAIALLFNEVFTNALKHAFPAGSGGTLRVSMVSADDHLAAIVEDDGVGMPQAQRPTTSFGQSLIKTLARQLRAEVAVKRVEPSGTRIEIRLPRERKVMA